VAHHLGLHQLVHDPQPDPNAQREQPLAGGTDELAERLLNLRRHRTLQRRSRGDDLRSRYVLHGVTEAGGSILAYQEWLESRDRASLDAIAEYNDDCRSTLALRDWLLDERVQSRCG
jgi:hypothetical protein